MHIDGRPVTVPKGTKVIRAAEQIGVAIPRFCDHPLLDPVAACRQCMVEVPDAGNGRGMKPQPACALDAGDGMVVRTGDTSAAARAAQAGMLEFLLINHPLDCPVCDKGGECPLQNQAMTDGRGESRYEGVKRHYPKPVALTRNLLLDRERCVLCQRCTRFGEQISGDNILSLTERGARSQIGIGPDTYVSYFEGNVTQICPVGALTSVDYRFQARPFDLVSTTTTCENCAAGCTLRVDQRHGRITRRLAGNDPSVNEEWSCDKGRFGFWYGADALTTPLVRRDGELVPASWPEALQAAADGLRSLRSAVGVLPGGRLTMENAVAYAVFARGVLGTGSVDARTRPGATAEEWAFLLRRLPGAGVTYADLETARQVVLVALEPEDECPMIFLRLRKAIRRGTAVTTVAPVMTHGSRKLSATVVAAAPGGEAAALSGVQADADTIVLVGERAGQVPGLLTAVESFAAGAGARLAWVPRRAGELGAIAVGCRPDGTGLSAAQMLEEAGRGNIGLLVGGVDLDDMDDPAAARQAVEKAKFVVSLEQRPSAVAERADVVLPVAALSQQAGSFLSWTKQVRPVAAVVAPAPMTDRRILGELAVLMGGQLGLPTLADAGKVVADLMHSWAAMTPPTKVPASRAAVAPRATGPVLATHRTLLAGSRCLDGSSLSSRPPVALAGAQVIRAAGLTVGADVAVTGPDGVTVVVPLAGEAAVGNVVWLADAPWAAGTPVTVTSTGTAGPAHHRAPHTTSPVVAIPPGGER